MSDELDAPHLDVRPSLPQSQLVEPEQRLSQHR